MMPGATQETLDAARKYEIADDDAAWRFLKSQGWTETKWVLTTTKPRAEISDKEWVAVDYLCDEWDWAFAGLAEPNP